jgi:hypothetical protein
VLNYHNVRCPATSNAWRYSDYWYQILGQMP